MSAEDLGFIDLGQIRKGSQANMDICEACNCMEDPRIDFRWNFEVSEWDQVRVGWEEWCGKVNVIASGCEGIIPVPSHLQVIHVEQEASPG